MILNRYATNKVILRLEISAYLHSSASCLLIAVFIVCMLDTYPYVTDNVSFWVCSVFVWCNHDDDDQVDGDDVVDDDDGDGVVVVDDDDDDD